MNSPLTLGYKKIFKIIIPLAIVAFILYAIALFGFLRTETVQAAQPMLFANVAIEDDSMRPLALGVNLPSVKTSVEVSSNASATGTTASELKSGNAEVRANENASFNVPDNLNTTADLNLYTKNLKANDKNISKVDIDEDRITIAYREPAKFLGFIPVSVTAYTKVNPNGKVTLHYPWYTFLSAKDDAQLRADLEARILTLMGSRNSLNVNGTASTTGSNINENASFRAFSARARAEVIQALHEALRSNASIRAGATVR